MRQDSLRDKFLPEQYHYSIASDIRNFPGMVNKRDPNLDWRLRWVDAIEKGRYSPKARISPLPADSKSGFDRIYQELSKDNGNGNVKVAECSKYAGHAISVLLSDKEITDEYNVCLAGIGPDQNHNIALLIPKGPTALKKGPLTERSLPEGSLIVDPWAMAMGYSAEASLAVKPEEYAYPEMLKKITLTYQSVNDRKVSPDEFARQSTADLASSESSVSSKTPGSSSSSSSSPPPIGLRPAVGARPVAVQPAITAARPVISARPNMTSMPSQSAQPIAKPTPAVQPTQPISAKITPPPGRLSSRRMAKLESRLFPQSAASTSTQQASQIKSDLTDLKKSATLEENQQQSGLSTPKPRPV